MEGGAFHAETGRLTLRENDPVKTDDIDWDSDEQTVEFEMEGTGCAEDGAGVLKFAATQSPNNSEKCRDQILSDDSIEQKYDWPREKRQAALERTVLPGMTQAQVMAAAGNPEKITRNEGGPRRLRFGTFSAVKAGTWAFGP